MKKFILAVVTYLSISPLLSQTVHKDYIDGQIYVQFYPGELKQVSKDDPNNIPLSKLTSVNKILSKYGVNKAAKPFYQADDDDKLPNIVQFNFSQKENVDALINELSEVYGIRYAEKVAIMETFTVAPNDYVAGTQPYLAQINALNAWTVFNGNSNIRVAIVDNAVRYTHQDLIANTYTNVAEATGVAGVDDDNNGYIDDINGFDVADNDGNPVPTNNAMDHGTHCAGIAAARNNNGIGIASIGWNLKMIPVKCTTDGGNVSSIGNGYGGIVYAARAGARVISCSWGGPGFSQSGQDVINYAWNKGAIIVAAAGNANTNTPSYPGAYARVYCVASCGSGNLKSGFSNYGQVGNQWVDITAPGESIYSTIPPNGYTSYGGTSMATPLVAGLAGMMLSVAPMMTQTAVLNCISSTAVNIYGIGTNSNYVNGSQLGAGRIEAFAAMNCASGYLLVPPIANFFTLTRNTCPNTPVTFQDSSLYLYTPPVWSWSFQSGTPATSTLTSPTVQWANPGTYSVALTVSTPNGSNTATKVSYITVAGPVALPLNEGFQNATFLPTNWNAYNIDNDNVYWARTTSCGGFGTSTACAVFDNAGLDAEGKRDEMRTPKYNFSNVVSARLRFDVAYKVADNTNTYYDTLKVKLTTDCGTNWTQIYAKGGPTLATAGGTGYPLFTPTAGEWRRDTMDITGLTAGQSNVMFSFVNHGHYGQGVYLDNINIFFPAPTASFSAPPPACAGTPMSFTNNSIGAGGYLWNFQGASPATSTLANPVVTYTAGGIFTASLTAFNGTTGILITKTVSVNGIPNVAANSQTICSGGTATLNATGAVTYSWNNGFVGNPLIVSPPSNTVYAVTGTSLGCTSVVNVSVTIGSQLSVYITPSQPSVCASGVSTLVASGAVSYTWNNNSNATSIVVSPTTSTTYSIIGTDGLCTGTTVLTVSVVPIPSLNIVKTPSTAVCVGETVTLTATGAYTSFTWVSPTVVANSMTVSPGTSTNYTIFASGNGGCSTSSVSGVTIKPLPVAVISTTDASCSNCPDGIAEVIASGGVGPYTYQWLPVGGTQSLVSGFEPGCYTVVVTGANSCVSEQTTCIGFHTGATQLQQSINSGLVIYPNPANTFVMIELQGEFSYTLHNNLGQVIISKANNNGGAYISLNELSKGVYTITIEKGDEKVRKKLILN